MSRILWLAPNLNHYKVRFLNRLAQIEDMELTVLAGKAAINEGHREIQQKETFNRIDVEASKKRFSSTPEVYLAIYRAIVDKRYDAVLVPMEKKNILLIVFLLFFRCLFHFSLVSYNHPTVTSGGGRVSRMDLWLTKIFFRIYDRVIFYTENSREWAVNNSMIKVEKAFFANNTLDTQDIWNHYTFKVTSLEFPTILFIGRLLPNKRLEDLIRYYQSLKKKIPSLRLIIIGDGPCADVVRDAAQNDKHIEWCGALVNEKMIANKMRQANLVFVPGHSGLSVLHAFTYGKPYLTIRSHDHAPEIEYLEPETNGLMLDGELEADCERVVNLLKNPEKYEAMCRASYNKAHELSIERWLEQMELALRFSE